MTFIKGHPFYPGTKNLFKKGQKPHNYIGEIKRSGYWYVHNSEHPFAGKQGYIAYHRLVMEEKLGRYLISKEAIHHINGDKTDNRIENLKLFATHGLHTKHAHPEIAKKQRILFKGKHFSPNTEWKKGDHRLIGNKFNRYS